MGIVNNGILAGCLTEGEQATLDALSVENGELLIYGEPVDTTLTVPTEKTPFLIEEKLLSFNLERLPTLVIQR